jgi:hypothetical protein
LKNLRNRKRLIKKVSVLGSGKVREKDPIYRQALELGEALAREGYHVCHGGYRGVMEAVAKGCRSAGEHNTAVIILGSSGKATEWASKKIGMPSWQSRLFKLVGMGDACIFLDGATGTLTELFVVLEMTNRRLLQKPIIVLGKKLGALLRSLARDPHFDLPPELHFVTTVSQAVKLLIGYRG